MDLDALSMDQQEERVNVTSRCIKNNYIHLKQRLLINRSELAIPDSSIMGSHRDEQQIDCC